MAGSDTGLVLPAAVFFSQGPSTRGRRFYYGAGAPIAELGAYDRVVLEPRLVTFEEVRALKDAGVTVHAYVSVGEIEPSDPLFGTLPADALPGSNPAWQTRVADLDHPAWRTHILESRIEPLSAWGFDGAFLDTLDSHHLLENPAAQREALVSLISRIQQRHPDLELLLNRGFEVLESLHAPVAGVVAESLYHGWTGQDYRTVPEEDRRWLIERLEEARSFAGEITVIDYLPFTAGEERRDLARRIKAAGFEPWVAEPSLLDLGTSDLIPVPRRLMVVHAESDALLTERDVHVMFGAIFDWMGYVVEYHDIRDGPPQLTRGVHAGVVSWLDASVTEQLNWFEGWLMETIGDGYPLVFLATLPTLSERVLDALGLEHVVPAQGTVAVDTEHEPALVGRLEAPFRVRTYQLPPVRSTDADNVVDVSLNLSNGMTSTPVVTAPWGGMALHPYIVEDYGEGRRRWLLDPYAFMARSLGYTPRPVLDTTTESGSRLLTVHVDGDGFPSRAFLPGSPLSADVLRTGFLERYDLPHTVSVIEGEIGAEGLYPDRSAELEAAARRIFALPNVEVASHSYSHPFFWRPNALDADQTLQYGMNLPIPGYRMNLEREIAGSISYVNDRLTPVGKQVRVFLWTGSADPDERALTMLREQGVLNVNGGNTNVVAADESLLNVWPQARLEQGVLQVYAPAMNENVYTNNWTGPFYGYRKAVETFQLTDRPRRLKPIGIYYHFYSATKPASIRALAEVYDWALDRDVLPVYLSALAERIEDYHRGWLARDLDGNWVAGDLGSIRTLRIPASLGFPAAATPGSIAGWRDLNADRYLHLTGDAVRFGLNGTAPEGVRLRHANAHVSRWLPEASGIRLHLQGFQPVRFAVEAAGDCRLSLADGVRVTGEQAGGLQHFRLTQKDTGDARLVCR